MCNKMSYESREAALKDAELIRARNRWKGQQMKGGRMRPYFCVHCSQFHLTSGSRSKEKKIRRSRKTREAS